MNELWNEPCTLITIQSSLHPRMLKHVFWSRDRFVLFRESLNSPGDSWESPKVRLHQSQSTSV